MEDNTYSKYLKYKNKNINAKKILLGGSSFNNTTNITTNIILCGTHNNRLACYFKSINTDNEYPNKGFNNCVIIRCFRDEKGFIKFNMIYEGESTGDDVVSVCSMSNGCWDIASFNNYFNNHSYNINLPDNTEIYLIRHALGVHNKMSLLKKVFNLKKDSELDIIGLEQAERAGIFLKGFIRNFYRNAKLSFMASHLIRTQQTIGIIMKMLEIVNSIYIVPCSHELIYSGNGNCDANLFQNLPVASNTPNCTNNSGTCGTLTNFSNRYNNYSVNINWDYYMEFYKLNMKCQDTDMVSEIIKLYLKNNF